jgi:glycerol-3-phosphate dehydrogenase
VVVRLALPGFTGRDYGRFHGWFYGTVRNTCATNANCHDEHAVLLDDGRTVYVQLRARCRYQWVRRPEEHLWEESFQAYVHRETDQCTLAGSCASEQQEEEADEVEVDIDSDSYPWQ